MQEAQAPSSVLGSPRLFTSLVFSPAQPLCLGHCGHRARVVVPWEEDGLLGGSCSQGPQCKVLWWGVRVLSGETPRAVSLGPAW